MKRRGLIFLLTFVTAVAMAGIARLDFDDDYRSVFRSDGAAFDRLEQLADDFGAEENTLFVVVEGEDVLSRPAMAALQRLTDAARDIDGIASVYSVLSVPGLASDPDTARRQILAHPLLRGRLVSVDARLTLVVLQLDDARHRLAEVEPVVTQVQAMLHRAADDAAVRVRLTGMPVLRGAIVRGVQRDQVRFNVAALLAVVVLGLLIFRRWSALVIVGTAPVLGMLWTIGALGWLGESINVLNNVVPQLVLVIGFADAVHLLTHFRHLRHAGRPRGAASREAARQVGKACALASLTTAIGFASLALVPVAIIQRFGLACALGAVLSFIAVITTVPLLAGTCLGDRALGPPPPVAPGTRLLRWLEPVLARPRRVAAAGLVLTLVLAATATQLRPDYRYREYLPTDHEAFQALSASDAALGGTLSVYALIEWDRAQLAGSALFGVLDDVTAAFEDAPKTHAPVSLATLLDALPGPPGDPAARLALLYYLPQDLVRRWFRLDRGRALVSAQVADEGAAALAPAFEELKGRLHAVAARHPGYRIHLTGLLVVSAESSLTMIGALARSLGLAAALIFGVVMLAFRSVRLGVVSLLPNLFPLATVAALLVWIGHPLQYTSATVFGIALGIAVDDTIHLLSGFQRAQRQGLNAGAALRQSLCRAGSAVVITTVLLVAGFGTLLLSGLPKIRLFGALACAALGVALLCDLILLPAVTLLAFGRTGRTLTSGFAFRHPALLFARATLKPDHLALTGWTWRGRYRRRIPLDRILHADARGDDELILWLFDGETLRLHIERAQRWREAIEARQARLENRERHPASAQG